jgi:hypothetical protein
MLAGRLALYNTATMSADPKIMQPSLTHRLFHLQPGVNWWLSTSACGVGGCDIFLWMASLLFGGSFIGVASFGLPWWVLLPGWGAAVLVALDVVAMKCERLAKARIRRQECVWCGQKLDDNLCGRCGQ